jgi:hypothetical protein
MKAPDVPTYEGDRSGVPSGFRIETRVLQQLEGPIVTPVIFRETLWPCVPANTRFTSSPEAAVTVTGGPLGTIA